MNLKPKSIKSHYDDSIIINSNNLKAILEKNLVDPIEINLIVSLLLECYKKRVDTISKECLDDWNRLESFSSPLILFILCIGKVLNNNQNPLSKKSKSILHSFLNSLESWMIW
jgi:hypothetical protein